MRLFTPQHWQHSSLPQVPRKLRYYYNNTVQNIISLVVELPPCTAPLTGGRDAKQRRDWVDHHLTISKHLVTSVKHYFLSTGILQQHLPIIQLTSYLEATTLGQSGHAALHLGASPDELIKVEIVAHHVRAPVVALLLSTTVILHQFPIAPTQSPIYRCKHSDAVQFADAVQQSRVLRGVECLNELNSPCLQQRISHQGTQLATAEV